MADENKESGFDKIERRLREKHERESAEPELFELLRLSVDYVGPAFVDLREVAGFSRAGDYSVDLLIGGVWENFELVRNWRNMPRIDPKIVAEKDAQADAKFLELLKAWRVARFHPLLSATFNDPIPYRGK
jgi:hypothetical protein